MSLQITAQDFFCGAGGSSTGIVNAGVEVIDAANHWSLAIETHNTNHPNTRHHLADLSQAHPSQFARTNIAWFSPSCTSHSLAKGRQRKSIDQLDLWGENKIDPSEERSRATMREVVEFTDYHRYEIIIVENVVDIRYWQHYDSWLQSMINLGYDHRALYLNAMFFGVPQSRDRVYFVFWKKSNHAPNLDFRPYAYCIDHGLVGAVQSWKKPEYVWGRYGKRRQYVYCCPQCGRTIEPFAPPAANVIDWSIPSPRIGDRERPLKPKTIKRILEGLRRFAPDPIVIDSAYSHAGDSGKVKSVSSTLATQTTRQTLGLIDPFIIGYVDQEAKARSLDEPLYTLPTSNAVGLVTPQLVSTNYYDDRTIPVTEPMGTQTTQTGKWGLLTPFISTQYANGGAVGINEPMPTEMGVNHHALVSPPFLAVLKNSYSKDGKYTLPPLSLDDPLSTIVASASQHALITPFLTSLNHSDVRNSPVHHPMPTVMPYAYPALIMAYYGNAPTFATTDEPLPTMTTVERHALIAPEDLIDDCGFRMLEPEELKRGMSFPETYIILGNKRDKVKQIGNAVCCAVAQSIVERCVAALAS